MTVIGVDPGVTGALALFDADGTFLQAVDMPSTSVRVGKTQRNRINGAALAALLREWKPSHAAVERVAPRGSDTPMTSGYLMLAAGIVEGVLSASGIPISFVETRAWRTAAGIKSAPGMSYQDRKEASRLRALQLFPLKAAMFARKKDADRAEAAMVGLWFLKNGGVKQ